MSTHALRRVLFLDIETVPQYPNLEDSPPDFQAQWAHKAKWLDRLGQDSDYKRAGIYAEFGRVAAWAVGWLVWEEGQSPKLHRRSMAHASEPHLLQEFASLLEQLCSEGDAWSLAAHNGREFDFPFLARRMLACRILLPELLDNRGRYARNGRLLDSLEAWKFGDYKHSVGLETLARTLGLPAGKQLMTGAEVYNYWYEQQNLDAIAAYAEEDVLQLCRIMCVLGGHYRLAEQLCAEDWAENAGAKKAMASGS